jgi:hypothetical protein
VRLCLQHRESPEPAEFDTSRKSMKEAQYRSIQLPVAVVTFIAIETEEDG